MRPLFPTFTGGTMVIVIPQASPWTTVASYMWSGTMQRMVSGELMKKLCTQTSPLLVGPTRPLFPIIQDGMMAIVNTLALQSKVTETFT